MLPLTHTLSVSTLLDKVGHIQHTDCCCALVSGLPVKDNVLLLLKQIYV